MGYRVSGIGKSVQGAGIDFPIPQTPYPIPESQLTVSSLTKAIRSVLEGAFAEVTVEGEISNFIDHRSGHRYWTLKDSEAQISAVFWKSRQLNFAIRDG